MNEKAKKGNSGILKYLLNIPVPWVFVLTYLFGVGLSFILPIHCNLMNNVITIKILGAIIFAIGALIAAWSLLIFRKAKTTTTPGDSSNKIIISGPYKISRNPMYVSLIIAYIGEAGMLVQIWPLMVLPLVFIYLNWFVIPLEEKVLENDFGEEYINYKRKVRRWL